MFRRRRAPRKVEQDAARLRLALLVVAVAHDRTDAGLVQYGGELELSRSATDHPCPRAASESAHGPAGQRASELRHVGLAIASAHAKRVQLHDLTSEILV